MTDLIQHYLNLGKLESTGVGGYWTDMGSPDALLDAANFIRNNPSKFERLKLFKIDNGLSVPLSQLEGWKKTLSSGENQETTQKQMEFYIKTLKKWNVNS